MRYGTAQQKPSTGASHPRRDLVPSFSEPEPDPISPRCVPALYPMVMVAHQRPESVTRMPNGVWCVLRLHHPDAPKSKRLTYF